MSLLLIRTAVASSFVESSVAIFSNHVISILGASQKKGVDYFHTYSLVTKIATIRTLVTLAAIHGLVVHQMDVKIAFKKRFI